MRCIQILDNMVRAIDLSPYDVFYGPLVDPPDASFICESAWKGLIAAWVEETKSELTDFYEQEAAYIKEMGWGMIE